MVASCVLAVSGTPGTGKTTLCEAMEGEGWQVLSLADLAEEHDCMGPVDEADGAAPIDVHRLAETWEAPVEGRWLVDGHLAHLLEVDGVVLLRCQPSVLNERLSARGYEARKVKANVEWEMTAGHWAELMEFEIDLPLLELDTTKGGGPCRRPTSSLGGGRVAVASIDGTSDGRHRLARRMRWWGPNAPQTITPVPRW